MSSLLDPLEEAQELLTSAQEGFGDLLVAIREQLRIQEKLHESRSRTFTVWDKVSDISKTIRDEHAAREKLSLILMALQDMREKT